MNECSLCSTGKTYREGKHLCVNCDGTFGRAVDWFHKKYHSRCRITSLTIITDRPNNVVDSRAYANVNVHVQIEYTVLYKNAERFNATNYIEKLEGVEAKRRMAFTNYAD